jgi:hypothetical protein
LLWVRVETSLSLIGSELATSLILDYFCFTWFSSVEA